MKNAKGWVSALQIPPQDYQRWEREVPRGHSLTFWCMSTGKINSEKYLAWAREHYGLPSLASLYFSKPTDLNFWQQIQNVANWSQEMLPLGQWDGVVYIGCVEPDPTVKWSFPAQWVLVKAHDLKDHWNFVSANVEKSFVSVPPTPDKQKADIKPLEFEAPQGFNFSMPSMPTINAGKDQDFMGQLVNELQPPPAPSEPSGLSQSFTAPSGLEFSKLNIPTPPQQAAVVAAAPTPPLPTPKPAVAVVAHATPSTSKHAVIVPLTETHTRAKATDSDDERFTTSQFDKRYINFLPAFKRNFQGGLIIEIRDNGFKVVVWTEGFSPASIKSRGPWSLEVASAFRIAYRTKLPYLGHVPATPINKDFFKAWGYPELPQQILIQPIVLDTRVTHLLLCLTDATKKNHTLLSEANQLVEDFMKNLGAAAA